MARAHYQTNTHCFPRRYCCDARHNRDPSFGVKTNERTAFLNAATNARRLLPVICRVDAFCVGAQACSGLLARAVARLTSFTDIFSCRLRTTKRSTARARHTMFRFEPHSSVGNICDSARGIRGRGEGEGVGGHSWSTTPPRSPRHRTVPSSSVMLSTGEHPFRELTRWHAWHRKSTTRLCSVARSMKLVPEPRLNGEASSSAPWLARTFSVAAASFPADRQKQTVVYGDFVNDSEMHPFKSEISSDSRSHHPSTCYTVQPCEQSLYACFSIRRACHWSQNFTHPQIFPRSRSRPLPPQLLLLWGGGSTLFPLPLYREG